MSHADCCFHGPITDHFASGGGAIHGIERALGRPCDDEINHYPEAIALDPLTLEQEQNRVDQPNTTVGAQP